MATQNDDADTETTRTTASLSQHLFEQFHVLVDVNRHQSTETKTQHAKRLLPHFQEPADAYISLAGNAHQAHLPPLPHWNTTFRKAYTILFWIRPRLQQMMEPTTSVAAKETLNAAAQKNLNEIHESRSAEDEAKNYKRILYRFSTAADDGEGTGVCVTCSQWKVVKNQNGEEDADDESGSSSSSKPRRPRTLQTTLTAYALPHNNPSKIGYFNNKNTATPNTSYSSWTQQTLELKENQWHLVGCTHVYPYLKRPVWSVTVDGKACGNSSPTELHYPILSESKHRARSMEYCSVLHNITAGGAALVDNTSSSTTRHHQPQRDDQKTASQLAAQAAADSAAACLPMVLDVAAVSLYADAITPAIQAVLAEAGVTACQQKAGRAVVTLPPVCNWSKGCSLQAGPKVGIPLTVHGTALELQHLVDSVQFAASAVTARILGSSSSSSNSATTNNDTSSRICCPYVWQPGKTDTTPRVGLIQPAAAADDDNSSSRFLQGDDELPTLYCTGYCTVVHALSEYLQQQQQQQHGAELKSLLNSSTTQNWSVAWAEQQAVSVVVLPFFLALSPPGAERQKLLCDSWKHLYALYSSKGSYAATLIQLLSSLIRTGGARIHEEVLQNGVLHILASSLRLGLIRAAKLKLFKAGDGTEEEFVKRAQKIEEAGGAVSSSSTSAVSPSYIPISIAEAVVELIEVCCGPPAATLDELTPAMQIRRTSDLALTAIFGLAMDFDVWAGDVLAAAMVWKAVAARYGGVCVTTGYVLRSQVSVQHFLDRIRLLRFEIASSMTTSLIKREAMESIALSLTQLLLAMLLSSLSNHRSISQGEKDVAACIGALSDCSLGSVTAHVVLSAIVGVLAWCEILPVEAAAIPIETSRNEEHKVEVASRMGRNLLMAQFHDVVAPVLLSRTVFSGDPSMVSQKPVSTRSLAAELISLDSRLLCWPHHWRLTLLCFSWIASIAGPEGLISSKSTGSLLLASGLAGSLEEALEDADKVVISTLFMPSPGMALLIGASIRSEWSYKDLLADRLQIMMPLLPGMIVSLLSHPSDSDPDTIIATKSLIAISDILTAVGGAFHRVFGGVIHSTSGRRQSLKTRGDGSSDAVKAAKTYVPYLLIISMILENHISIRSSPTTNEHSVSVYRSLSLDDQEDTAKRPGLANTTSTEDLVGEIVVAVPGDEEKELDTEALVSFLKSCQRSVLSTAGGLISNAMSLGGAGAAIPLWKSILSTLEESVVYAARDCSSQTESKEVLQQQGESHDPARSIIKEKEIDKEEEQQGDEAAESKDKEKSATALAQDEAAESKDNEKWATALAQDVLCRLIALVLIKSLKREQQWDVIGFELSSALSRVCLLVEERELLAEPAGISFDVDNDQHFSDDQIVLMCALLDILAYGRDTAGWCQLALPTMTSVSDRKTRGPSGDMTANSKLLLPVLQPCLRVLLKCLEFVTASAKILIVRDTASEAADGARSKEVSLFDRILTELDQTLTAAIVGLAFSSARDTALNAMTTFRKCIAKYIDAGDENRVQLCKSLLTKVAGELKVRYESERRLRETALFDAYEDEGGSSSAMDAAHGSLAVERLILGGDTIADMNSNIEEVTFNETTNQKAKKASDDFVLFHEPSFGDQEAGGKVGFALLQGLGAALEEWKMSSDPSANTDESFSRAIAALAPYLDAWEEMASRDAKDTELVKLFDSKVHFADFQPKDRSTVVQNQLPILGSETAADAMSTFFEFAASEKSRLKEISVRFLPSNRSSKIAFAERFCWARYMEVVSPGADSLWERAVPDGNRDVRSRLPTMPCSSQFRRYLPKYLDDGSDRDENRLSLEGASPESSPNVDISRRRSSVAPAEIDAFTKSLLEAGNLEIVDITKKEIMEEEFSEPLQPSEAELDDEDETGLFAESDSDRNGLAQEETGAKQAPDDNNVDADSGSEDMNLSEPHLQAEVSDFASDLVGKGYHSITTSSFSTPPDNSSSSLSLAHSAAAGMIEQHVDNCLHVKAEGSRHCTMLLTSSHLILEYDSSPEGYYEGELLAMQEEADRQKMADDVGAPKDADPEALNQQKDERRHREEVSLRPKSIRWNLSEVSHIYLRRYRLRDSALELFVIPTGGTSFGGFGLFSPASSLFLDFGPGYEGKTRRDEAAFAIMRRAPPQAIKQWPDRSEQFLHDQLSRLTMGWVEGRITNFDYLLHLNILSGRSYNDICQYPVFPWVLSDYTSDEIPDLTDRQCFRDLSKPVGALNPARLEDFLERFKTFSDPSIPPFMYGSHYSTSAGVVLHFLVRMHPFAGLHRQLQGGHFDVADRLFSSVPRTWSMCTGSSAAEVKELTPEWYSNPAFLKNVNNFKLGRSQDGEVLGDVVLPPWAKGSPEKFIEVMRAALESDICSEMLSDWIDLIFGRKQQGPAAIQANNVFFYLTYYGTVDVASIEDEALRKATELQIAHFGQCPMQLFRRAHVQRLPRNCFHLSLYQLLSTYSQRPKEGKHSSSSDFDAFGARSPTIARARLHSVFGQPLFLPFFSAPMSSWVHSDPPPPGPHSPLVAVRFAGTDRCLALDAKGIFHYFRWAWRAEEPPEVAPDERHFDSGCFVAQRELPRFRSVPRLLYTPSPDDSVAVAISKTLFANRSVLLVLSDGDGSGSLGMQLVDPAKGDIRGAALVPQVHSARITCIATDPIGTAAGHGGVGGELAIVGSLDGNASLWRFMSSHYLPLRPRVRLVGHGGHKVVAVALCSTIHVAATLSTEKCCLHSIGNGALIRSIEPPSDTIEMQAGDDVRLTTKFADTAALAVSVQGYVVTVCETTIQSSSAPDRTVVTLHLFTVEGISLGSTPLESWRGLPHKMHCTPDGTTVMVCCGRGVTMHRLSACQPLEFLDEFQITESDDLGTATAAAWDIDLGPALNRPVVAAAACSAGALRLHALPGISAWSERHKKSGLSQTVGTALANPAKRLNRAMRDGIGIGRQIAGMGRDLQQEVSSDVKERGVSGFLGTVFRKNSSRSNNK